MTKHLILEKTIEIAKEYARSGGSVPIDRILDPVYRKIEELDISSQVEG